MKSIGSFKLHKRGEEGISITSEQLSKHFQTDKGDLDSQNQIYHDEVSTFRRESVPKHILDAIDRLKYFFLNITGHWISLYNKFIDLENFTLLPLDENVTEGRRHLQSLWESTFVTQVKFDHNSFTIIGWMEVIDNKALNLSPPKVTADDDLDFYGDARGRIQSIIKLLVDYFSTAAINDIEDYRKYLLEHTDETGRSEIAKFDEQQILNRVMDKFAKSGAIIMMDNNEPLELGVEQNKDVSEELEVEAPTAEFEPEPIEPEQTEPVEPEQMESGEGWTPQPEKAKDPFGAPAAEDGQAEVVDANLEFSDSPDGVEPTEGIDDIPDEDFV